MVLNLDFDVANSGVDAELDVGVGFGSVSPVRMLRVQPDFLTLVQEKQMPMRQPLSGTGLQTRPGRGWCVRRSRWSHRSR